CPLCCFFFSSRRRHTRSKRDWSSDVCSSDLVTLLPHLCHKTSDCPLKQKSLIDLYLSLRLIFVICHIHNQLVLRSSFEYFESFHHVDLQIPQFRSKKP